MIKDHSSRNSSTKCRSPPIEPDVTASTEPSSKQFRFLSKLIEAKIKEGLEKAPQEEKKLYNYIHSTYSLSCDPLEFWIKEEKLFPLLYAVAVEQSIRRLTVEMKDLEPQTIETNSTDLFEPQEGPSSKETHSLWESFDKKIMEASSRRTSTTDAFIEVRRYFEEINIDRKEDPLTWWKVNQSRFPKLQMIAKKYLCIPGSSVPSERLFSKAGELVSEKRNRIKPKNIDMMLFLNNNLTYTVLHRLLSIIIYTLR